MLDTLALITGALLLPGAVWLILTVRAYKKAERGTASYRRRKAALIVLLLSAAVFAAVQTGQSMIWGIRTAAEDCLLLIVFLGIPLTVFSVFISALIRFLRTPKDSPERQHCKRLLLISGISSGIMIAAISALLIMLMIGISHM